jgi:hypothetical protein
MNLTNKTFRALRSFYLCMRFELGSITGQYPFLLYFWQKLFRPNKRTHLLSQDTELVIEGFLRCGNTFSLAAFTLSQQREVIVAHHTHKPGQIIEAVRKSVPILIVIRNPIDTVVSLVLQNPHLSIRQGLRCYNRYYRKIMVLRNDYVLADFTEITSDFGKVVIRINDRFDTTFLPFDHTKENVAASFQLIDQWYQNRFGKGIIDESYVARPSNDRNTLKPMLREKLTNNKNVRNLLSEANQIYNWYLESLKN